MRLISPIFFCAFLTSAVLSGEEQAVTVKTATSSPSANRPETISLTGTVVSQRRASLSVRMTGLVKDVIVDAGTQVTKGDKLLVLDSELAEIDLELIRAQIRTAGVTLADAIRRRDEVTDLAREGAFAISEERTLKAAVETQRAEIAALKVEEKRQAEMVARHRLHAPFSGLITRKETEAGEWVATGDSVLELVESDSLWFDVQIAQEYLPALQASPSASLLLDAYPDRSFPSRVDVQVPVKDPVSRTFLTRLTFDDPEQLAKPGMSGRLTLGLAAPEDAGVSVPRDAVVRGPDGDLVVWIAVEEEGRHVARRRPVTVKNRLGEFVTVEKGIEQGVEVIVRGNESLEDGQVIAPEPMLSTSKINAL